MVHLKKSILPYDANCQFCSITLVRMKLYSLKPESLRQWQDFPLKDTFFVRVFRSKIAGMETFHQNLVFGQTHFAKITISTDIIESKTFDWIEK